MTSNGTLRWDAGAVLSILSFNYACGDLTLVREIARRPWLSSIDHGGHPVLEPIPPHGTRWESPKCLAATLRDLLLKEVSEVCRNHDPVYVLLSGGIDSRIIAAAVAELYRRGRLNRKPIAVTWGLADSADVVYARAVAEILEFEWEYAELKPATILRNFDSMATLLGGLVSPIHLHNMSWFERVSRNSIVLAGSYGNSIGRGEFSKKHILEEHPHIPINPHHLMSESSLSSAAAALHAEMQKTRARAPGVPRYVTCEHEGHAQYMRGMIAHSMSIISNHCRVYQVLTHPDVYSFIWSIHPSLRFGQVYAELLESLDPRLARLAIANTGRAFSGRTERSFPDLRRDIRFYRDWIRGPLFEEIAERIDAEWFVRTGLFSERGVNEVVRAVRTGVDDLRPYELFTWLGCMRQFSRWTETLGRPIAPFRSGLPGATVHVTRPPTSSGSRFRKRLQRIGPLYALVKKSKRWYLKRRAILRYPPARTG